MSSDRQRSNDESPSTGNGSSEAHQRDLAVPEPEGQQEGISSVTQKTTAKLPTSCVKRLQKELTEVIHVSPPNCAPVLQIFMAFTLWISVLLGTKHFFFYRSFWLV
uniref:Uncharacterized protein n=1 Tax=Lynx canadensis TaxID=61383 RepID=A0A667I3C6_LYNCA